MYEQLKLNNQLCFRLYTASRLVTSAYYPYLQPMGITYPQYLVLMVLWEKDHQPVNDIAHLLHLETNTVTPLLQRMEKEGLLSRKRGKEDTRQRIVSLTPKGKQLEEQAKDVPFCMAEDIAKNMCRMPQSNDVQQLIPILDVLIEGLAKQTNEEQ